MYRQNFDFKTVTLNAVDLNKMKHFYQEIMGLHVIQETDDVLYLGLKNSPEALLKIVRVDTAATLTAGLYHIAYLLPSRKDLGNFLYHLAESHYPIVGASDHAYSEAVYLNDPEGNGIEVYTDRPESVWDKRENGIIMGITERMDIESVLNEGDQHFETLPIDTIIGHVHLSVTDVETSNHFYETILGFTNTSQFGNQVAFYGMDGYHHQLAGNIWQTNHTAKNNPFTPGLARIHVQVSPELLEQTVTNIKNENYSYNFHDHHLSFDDPNGISYIFTT
ncbi:VOC family protein [Vagococcus lutrae]|uniref:VOC family protein n=1 Tax=Vagococcus lutrae TaxID=81947 RepID=UPI0028906785|nr:VOC family protein [Vagococcus lutrae]MDT2801091.1 VOC family protein [Vagococcus lutrae]